MTEARHALLIAGTVACMASAACVAALPQDAPSAPEAGVIELRLVRPPAANEMVALELRVGVLPSGARVRVLSESGDVIGVVAPFGRMQAGGVSAHVLPLPQGLIRDGRVRLRITLDVPGAPARPAGAAEVEKVSLIYVPIGGR